MVSPNDLALYATVQKALHLLSAAQGMLQEGDLIYARQLVRDALFVLKGANA